MDQAEANLAPTTAVRKLAWREAAVRLATRTEDSIATEFIFIQEDDTKKKEKKGMKKTSNSEDNCCWGKREEEEEGKRREGCEVYSWRG